MNIYVSNLSYKAEDNDLQNLFEEFGTVSSANIIKDRETGRSRGFGFVEMPEETEGAQAIASLNGKQFLGRDINVAQARERSERSPRN